MKAKFNTHKILIILFLTFSVQTIAQNTLNGTVIDKKTQETLIGASVIVVGENRGTSTDFDGKLKIPVKKYL